MSSEMLKNTNNKEVTDDSSGILRQHEHASTSFTRGGNNAKPVKTSKELAAEALVTDNNEGVFFDPENMQLDEWLEKYRPSHVSSDKGIGWIWMMTEPLEESSESEGEENIIREGDGNDSDKDMDVEGKRGNSDAIPPHVIRVMLLESAWKRLQKSGCQITSKTVENIASKYDITHGKWLFFSSSGAKIDYLWKLVCIGMKSGTIEATSAKVSPYDPNAHDNKHVVCIYNEDFTNREEVACLENQIREAGIKCQLLYKPDAYTYLGIYRNNEWAIKPTLYTSDYHILLKKSIIKW